MNKDNDNISFFGVLKSVLSAFLGVQSHANRKRDFETGNPMHFIYIGLMTTVVFILVVLGAVKLVLYLMV